jgi:hypothetical protein
MKPEEYVNFYVKDYPDSSVFDPEKYGGGFTDEKQLMFLKGIITAARKVKVVSPLEIFLQENMTYTGREILVLYDNDYKICLTEQ